MRPLLFQNLQILALSLTYNHLRDKSSIEFLMEFDKVLKAFVVYGNWKNTQRKVRKIDMIAGGIVIIILLFHAPTFRLHIVAQFLYYQVYWNQILGRRVHWNNPALVGFRDARFGSKQCFMQAKSSCLIS